MKNVLIVTHHDLDGWMSAVAVKSAVKSLATAEVVWDANPSVEKTIELIGDRKYDAIYILDRQCPSAEFFGDADVNFYDHHRGTAVDGVNGEHNETMAACGILAKTHGIRNNMGTNLVEFCEMASLWDTFQWKTADEVSARKAIVLNKIKLMYSTFEEFENSIGELSLDEYITKHAEAVAIADKIEEEYISHKMKTIKMAEFRGVKVGFFTWEKLVSQISDRFLTENSECDIAIGYNAEYNSISFRSKITDVSVIAKEFGGGGHIKAAGCPAKGELVDFVRQFILN